MATVWIKEFSGGLDTRRMGATTPGNALIRAVNCHISRGGEIEKRAAFVTSATLPAGTLGLAATLNSLYVFGSGAPPTMPPGVLYQRLQHANGTTALTRVLSWDLYAGLLYVVGEFADGSIAHFYNGVRVTTLYDGRASAGFTVESGHAAITTPDPIPASTVDQIWVGGVALLTSAVTWATSNEATASAIANAINTGPAATTYSSTAAGARVNIIAVAAGAAPNGRAVSFSLANDFVVNPATGLVMQGGSSTGVQAGDFVKTVGQKMYATASSHLAFSGVAQPTKWTTDTVGAGFIDLSAQASGAEKLTAMARYQSLVAIFAERTIQVWSLDPDPALNRLTQVLNNTGTSSPLSVTQFGDSDLFYLDESGLRSMRARDSSNAAATTDIGVPIDTIITAKMRSLTDAERTNVIGLIEPRDGRFWLIMKDIIYVFSYFSGAKISAWTTYEPSDTAGAAFNIEAACTFNKRVYARSGNRVFAHGGTGSEVAYDETVADVWLPYLDANSPTRSKSWNGLDAALEGEWTASFGMDSNIPTAEDRIAILFETSYSSPSIPSLGDSTHISPRFRTRGAGAARLGSIVLHFGGDSDED